MPQNGKIIGRAIAALIALAVFLQCLAVPQLAHGDYRDAPFAATSKTFLAIYNRTAEIRPAIRTSDIPVSGGGHGNCPVSYIDNAADGHLSHGHAEGASRNFGIYPLSAARLKILALTGPRAPPLAG